MFALDSAGFVPLLVLMCDCFSGTFCGLQPLNVTESNRKAQNSYAETKHKLMIRRTAFFSTQFQDLPFPILFISGFYGHVRVCFATFLLSLLFTAALLLISLVTSLHCLSFTVVNLSFVDTFGSSPICTAELESIGYWHPPEDLFRLDCGYPDTLASTGPPVSTCLM